MMGLDKMTMLFKAVCSPEGAQRIPGCCAENEQSRNTRCSFRATLMAFLICLSVLGCAAQSDKTSIIKDDCEQTCSVISAAKKHALEGDRNFFETNHLHSVTNTGNVSEVRFQPKAPPGMVMLGGGAIFFVDRQTLSVIKVLFEQ
jgi:hypothetical protein